MQFAFVTTFIPTGMVLTQHPTSPFDGQDPALANGHAPLNAG